MYKACVFLKIANTCHSVSLPQNSFIFQQKPTPRVHNWTQSSQNPYVNNNKRPR